MLFTLQSDFSKILRTARKEKNLTMLAVAERTGIPLPIYKMIENGKIIPDKDKLKVICAFFNLTLKG